MGGHWLKKLAPQNSKRRDALRRTRRTVERFLPSLGRFIAARRSAPAGPAFDAYNPRALVEFLKSLGRQPPPPDVRQAEANPLGAAGFVLGMLHARPEFRVRFDKPLTSGLGGAFCEWLRQHGASELRLTPLACQHIQNAFALRLAQQVRIVFDHHVHVRERFPLALTPWGRGDFVHWLLEPASDSYGIRAEAALWFLFESSEDAGGGLADTYLMSPEWQRAQPLGLTVFGRQALARWVSRRYGIRRQELDAIQWPEVIEPADQLRLLYQSRPQLQALAPLAFQDERDSQRLLEWAHRHEKGLPAAWFDRCREQTPPGRMSRLGANVVAHFRYPSGLQEAALSTVAALEHAGVRTSLRDIPASPDDLPDRGSYLGLEVHDCTLLHVAPEPILDRFYPCAGLHLKPGVRRIAVWYWELERVPPEWVKHAQAIHEIWAPTRFIAEAMSKVMPVPVVPMLPGVRLGPFTALPKSHFGLDGDRFLFLFMFDMNSIMQRKNPLELIAAFRRAFEPSERAALAIKVTRGDRHPANLQKLREAAAEAGVAVIDCVMSREESYALMAACDCYVSLHRSEGFGFTLAEAMLLGKPVIATGYSGNMDFMNSENSLLVGYRKVEITEDLPAYPKGSLWAQPDLDQAATHMRWVFENREAARAVAARGQVEAASDLSMAASGKRMRRRLAEIRDAGLAGVCWRRAG